MNTPSSKNVRGIALIVATVTLAACASGMIPNAPGGKRVLGSPTPLLSTEVTVPMTNPEAPVGEKIYAAVATGQIIVDGDAMRIGVGNLEADEEYVDASGATRRGPTAGLWFYFRDRPDLDQFMRVYENQVIETFGHTIRVVSVNPESNHVLLGIVATENAATPGPK